MTFRSKRRPPLEPPRWLRSGVYVDYHARIGGPITEADLIVETEPSRLGDNRGQWVVWLRGKRGCVAVEAVSPVRGVELEAVEAFL